jgi:hypothetical protein
MIALDEQQEKVLAEVAEIIGRSAARRARRRLRRIALAGLSMWRLFRPNHFHHWNRQRVGRQDQITAD